jgi:predicted ATPase
VLGGRCHRQVRPARWGCRVGVALARLHQRRQVKRRVLPQDRFVHALQLSARLVVACPTVTVLATSREPLAVQAEHRYPVPPLALPAPGTAPAAAADVGAVALFCERARAHDPEIDFGGDSMNAIAEICRRVDGLPLAIELAAARCGLLSPPEIATRLDGALDGLGAGPRDAPARQQTLSATIDWSHSLLNPEEQACFSRFSVFAGGATVAAA